MRREERLLRDLCLEIARGEVGSQRFNELVLQLGLCLDDSEWETANRVLGRSECMTALASEATLAN